MSKSEVYMGRQVEQEIGRSGKTGKNKNRLEMLIGTANSEFVPKPAPTVAMVLSCLEKFGSQTTVPQIEAETKFFRYSSGIEETLDILLEISSEKEPVIEELRTVHFSHEDVEFSLRLRRITPAGAGDDQSIVVVTIKEGRVETDSVEKKHKIKVKNETEFTFPQELMAKIVNNLSELGFKKDVYPFKMRKTYHFRNERHNIHIALETVVETPGEVIQYIEIEAKSPEEVIAFVEEFGSFLGISMSKASPISTLKFLRERALIKAKS